VGKPTNSLSDLEEKSLKDLIAKRQDLLEYEETNWHLKSMEVWLKEGDNNNKFFHQYVTYRNSFNSIWEIKDQNWKMVNFFEGIAEVGKEFYANLFKEPICFPIE